MDEIRQRLQEVMVLEHQGQWPQAARVHRQVADLLKQAGENPLMGLALAYGCWLKAGDAEQTQGVWQELQQLGLPGPKALLPIYVKLGREQLAQALLEQLRRDDPEQLLQLLQAVQAGMGQPDAAGDDSEQLLARVQADAEDGEALAQLVTALAGLETNIRGACQLLKVLEQINDPERRRRVRDGVELRNPDLCNCMHRITQPPLYTPVPDSVAELTRLLAQDPEHRRRILDAAEFHDEGHGIRQRYLYQEMGCSLEAEIEPYNQLGQIGRDANQAIAQGDLARAGAIIQSGLAQAQGYLQQFPQTLILRRMHSVLLNIASEIYQAQGQLANAADAFRNGFQLSEELVSRTDRSIQSLRDLSVSWNKLGDVYQAQGQLANAADAFRKGFHIDEELVSRTDRSIQSLRDLSVSWNKLGDVYQAQGQLANAADSFRKGFQLREELVSRTDRSIQSLRDLSLSWNKLGDVYQAQGQLANAADAFRNGFQLREELVSRTDRSIESLRDLSISWNKLGAVYQAQGQLANAADAFRNGFQLREELVSRTERSIQSLRDLSLSRERLGGVAWSNREAQVGREHYTSSLHLNREISQTSFELRQTISDVLISAGQCRAHGEYRLALDFLALARECWDRQYAQASESKRLLLSQSALRYSREWTRVVCRGYRAGELDADYWRQLVCALEDVRTRHLVELVQLREAQPDFSALEQASRAGDAQATAALAAGREAFAGFRALHQELEQAMAQLRTEEGQWQELLAKRADLRASSAPQAQEILQAGESNYREVRQRLEAAQDRYRKLREQLSHSAAAVRAAAPGFLPEAGAMDFAAITALAEPDQALVTFSVTPEGTVVVVLTADTRELEENLSLFVIDSFTSADLVALLLRQENGASRGWLTALQSGKEVPEELDHLGKALAKKLFAPVERSLHQRGITSIILVPGAELALCPLHLLPIDERLDADGVGPLYLQDRYRVAYASSFRLLEISRARRGRKLDQVHGVANPLGDLLFADIEADDLAALLDAAAKTSNFAHRHAATLAAALAMLAQHGGLHFCCHGQFNFLRPLHSCLLLAGDDGQPPQAEPQSGDDHSAPPVYEEFVLQERAGERVVLYCDRSGVPVSGEIIRGEQRHKFIPLTLAQILQTTSFGATAQIVLSACEVGLADFEHLNEVVSFPTALLCGGAPAVVAGMWRVNDLSTCIIMAEYYRHLLAGADKITALRQAQQRVQAMGKDELYQRLEEWTTRAKAADNAELAAALTTELRLLRVNDEERPFAHPYYWGAFYLSGETGPVA